MKFEEALCLCLLCWVPAKDAELPDRTTQSKRKRHIYIYCDKDKRHFFTFDRSTQYIFAVRATEFHAIELR